MKALDTIFTVAAAMWMRLVRRQKGAKKPRSVPEEARGRVRYAGEAVGRAWNRHQRRALAAARRGKGGWGWRKLAARKGEAKARARFAS